MKVTVDANIVFSCIIKDSYTRKLFFNPELSVFAPEYIIEELIKYVFDIKEKSGLADSELLFVIEKIIEQIEMISDKDLAPYLPAAASLIEDKKDLLYLACALYEDTGIWSNDKDFKSQNRVRTFTTKELYRMIGSL